MRRETHRSLEIDIVKGHISKDHLHILVSVSPFPSVRKVMHQIKDEASRIILSKEPKENWPVFGRFLGLAVVLQYYQEM